MAEAVYKHDDGDATKKMLDELIDLYIAIHNQPEYECPMYECGAFVERTNLAV